MSYSLTEQQKQLVRWLVHEVRDERLAEEFHVAFSQEGGFILGYQGTPPRVTKGVLDALEASGMLTQDIRRHA